MRTLLAFLALSTAAAAQVTVTGKVLYEDRPYTTSGFGVSVNRPVRQAEIQLLDSAGTTVLANGFTNETGDYSLTFLGPDQDVMVRVFARRTTGKINAVVKTVGGAIYTVVGALLNTASSPFPDLVITQAGGAGGPFNIFDCAVKSFQYLASLETTLPDTPSVMAIHWPHTDTFFQGSVPGIFLLGGPPDPDEYDDDIIFHEMGHWAAFFYSKDDTIGGPHMITDQVDPRLSWSEGWGHYWSAVVRQWANANVASEYLVPRIQVDLKSSNPPSWFDVEVPSFSSSTIMATNELAVAAVLWDLVDPDDLANEPFDLLSGLEPEIWRTVHQRIPGMSDITLEDFHAGLMLESPGIRLNVSGDPVTLRIFNARLIRYYADPSETNDNPVGAPTLAGALTLRTSYPAGDQDWFTVDAVPGTLVVETLNLGDGADTVLQLWDATGSTMLASNNNRAGNDKSSRLTRSVSAPTTFKVHVAQAGPIVEHGYYDLQIQTLPKKKGGGDGGCGLTGGEAVILLGLLRRARRR